METKKLKDYGLWSFSYLYKFDDGTSHFYEDAVSAIDVADFLQLPLTQKNLDRINRQYESYQNALEHDPIFSDWIIERFFERASRAHYEEVD